MNNIMIIITLTSVDFILSLNGGKSCLKKAPLPHSQTCAAVLSVFITRVLAGAVSKIYGLKCLKRLAEMISLHKVYCIICYQPKIYVMI